MTREEAIQVLHHIVQVADTSDCGIKEIDGIDEEALEMAIKALEQEPKTGHWIEKDDNLYECSECGQYIYSETEHDLLEFHAFCSRCGCRMVEPQESEEV